MHRKELVHFALFSLDHMCEHDVFTAALSAGEFPLHFVCIC